MKIPLFLVICLLVMILADTGEGWWRRRRRRRRPPPRVNCVVSGWSGWRQCSKSCGGGVQTRSRRITAHPQHGGSSCPSLSQQQHCNTKACPCLVSNWGRWSRCSRTCDRGTQVRTRHVTRPGSGCPQLMHRRFCEKKKCPCKMSAWSRWGSCSKACGGGFRYRSRRIIKKASPGGSCPANHHEKQPCNTKKCINCKVGRWRAWTKCTKPCDSGIQKRSRKIIQHKGPGGRRCPETTESRACNVHKCPCKVSVWSPWGSCNKPCEEGQQWRSRSVVRKESPGGRECPSLRQKRGCNTEKCQHCMVSTWSRWEKCTRPCDGGTKTRTRRITQPRGKGGRKCPKLRQTIKCNTGKCGCTVSAWSAWGSCSETCGPGKQKRDRRVLRPPSLGGKPCPSLSEKRSCQKAACHCQVSAWGAWGRCSKPCGIGTQMRNRTIVKKDSPGGMACPILRQKQSCNLRKCPRHCEVSRWGRWSKCLDPGKNYCLGYGVQQRRRRIVVEAAFGGKVCPRRLRQMRRCKCKSCARPVCKPTNWGAWSPCRRVDGCSVRFRSRKIRSGNKCKTIQQCQYC